MKNVDISTIVSFIVPSVAVVAQNPKRRFGPNLCGISKNIQDEKCGHFCFASDVAFLFGVAVVSRNPKRLFYPNRCRTNKTLKITKVIIFFCAFDVAFFCGIRCCHGCSRTKKGVWSNL